MGIFGSGARFAAVTAFILALTGAMLSITALGTTTWRYSLRTSMEYGLFEDCNFRKAERGCRLRSNVEPYVNATRAFIIMGIIMVVAGILLLTLHILGKLKKKGHVLVGVVLLVACIFLVIGCAVYTAKTRENIPPGQEFGYSLWMAWAASIITFLSAPLGFLSKRDDYGFMA